MNNEKNDIKHHLSFHKKNETPWTIKEAINILHYVGSYKQIQDKDYGIVSSSYQPFFDAVADKEGEPLMANWSSNENIGKCKKVFYEDIFPVNKNILTEDNTIRIADLEKTRMRTHINKYFQIVSDEKSCNVKNGDIVKAVEALTYLSFDNLSTGKKNFCLCKHKAAACFKPKTDLQAASKWCTKYFGPEGNYIYESNDSPAKAAKVLKNPDNLGNTARTYKAHTQAQTNVPVKSKRL